MDQTLLIGVVVILFLICSMVVVLNKRWFATVKTVFGSSLQKQSNCFTTTDKETLLKIIDGSGSCPKQSGVSGTQSVGTKSGIGTGGGGTTSGTGTGGGGTTSGPDVDAGPGVLSNITVVFTPTTLILRGNSTVNTVYTVMLGSVNIGTISSPELGIGKTMVVPQLSPSQEYTVLITYKGDTQAIVKANSPAFSVSNFTLSEQSTTTFIVRGILNYNLPVSISVNGTTPLTVSLADLQNGVNVSIPNITPGTRYTVTVTYNSVVIGTTQMVAGNILLTNLRANANDSSAFTVYGTLNYDVGVSVYIGTTLLGIVTRSDLLAGKTFTGVSLSSSTPYKISVTYNSNEIGNVDLLFGTPPGSLLNYKFARMFFHGAGWNGGISITGVVTNSAGDIFVSGLYSGTWQPPYIDIVNSDTKATIKRTTRCDGSWKCMFITKFDIQGGFKYHRMIVVDRESVDGRAHSVACDSNGNAYLVGYYTGLAPLRMYDENDAQIPFNIPVCTVFAPGVTVPKTGFLTKFGPTGNVLYSRIIETSANDVVNSVKCDSVGNVFIAGTTDQANADSRMIFRVKNENDTVLASATQSINTNICGYVTKFDSSGNHIWSKFLASIGNFISYGTAITCDVSGNIYVGGNAGENNPISVVSLAGIVDQTITLNRTGGYVFKLSTSGSVLAKYGVNTEVRALVCDRLDNLLIASNRTTTFINNSGISQSISRPPSSANSGSIIKISPTGTVMFTRHIVGSETTDVNSIACDSIGNVYMAGGIRGTYISIRDENFGKLSDGPRATMNGSAAYICSFDPSGNFLQYASLDGDGSESINCMTVNQNGQIIFGGSYNWVPTIRGTEFIKAWYGGHGYICSLGV